MRVMPRPVCMLTHSYYEEDPQNNPLSGRPSLTAEIIKEQIDDSWTRPFYDKIVKTVMGLDRPPTCPEKSVFWNSVCYYVFIQDIVGSCARQRPTRAMWRAGEDPFLAVLKILS